jgi:hypothetical protein
MLEFALLAPMLMILLLGLIDIARAVYYYDVISQAAREGAREAILSYNQCTNDGPTCSALAPPSGSSVVGVKNAMKRATGGILTFTFLESVGVHTGKAPACNPPSGLPPQNTGCVWIFQVGGGLACSDANNKAGGPNPAPPNGTGTDSYPQCDFDNSRASGNLDVTVEVEYNFQPYTPLISQFKFQPLWAKSQMRAEY